MSCCGGSHASGGSERRPGTGCCGSNCTSERDRCLASEPRIRSCMCQENVGCLDRADCGGFRPRGTAATGACPGPCQCVEEEAWNRNIPPKPNCEWLSNFSELRRQWSDHARKNNCKCCSCAPTKKAAPCKPCLPPISSCGSSMKLSTPHYNSRLAGGACGGSGGCSSSQNYHESTEEPSNNSCQPCAPSPKPILKKRSCCQCTENYCMCQPMPRTCHCPPPVKIDARAERECSCECPSSPECACPPSERKFPRTQVKCPNAKLCNTPRLQPGPKCNCSECQPDLPPPCDPCTSSKCHPGTPRISPHIQESSWESSNSRNSHRTSTPCCRKNEHGQSRPETSDSSGFYSPCRGSGQLENSFRISKCCQEESEEEEEEGEVLAQCRCGPDAKKCDEKCHHCCSIKCANESYHSIHEKKQISPTLVEQCSCGPGGHGCDNNCNFCCSIDCENQPQKHIRIAAGSESYLNEFSRNSLEIPDINDDRFRDISSPDRMTHGIKPDEKKIGSGGGKVRRSSKLLQSLRRAKNLLP